MAKKKTTPKKKAAKAVRKSAAKTPTSARKGEASSQATATNACPDAVHDDDPGDDVARRFRYQHAYGVILLIGAATGKLKCKEIWCEHHDDFLGMVNGSFHSFQVKTTTPENGPWTLTKPLFIDAVKKFCSLHKTFGEKIAQFNFVSNVKALNSTAKAKVHLSPIQLVNAVRTASELSELPESFATCLSKLATACEADEECLFAVLGRIEFVTGPSLDDIEAVLVSVHLVTHKNCGSLSHATLSSIRDELIQAVHDASSRTVNDPAKHWSGANGPVAKDPWLQAKRLLPSLVELTIANNTGIAFRFSPIGTLVGDRQRAGELSVLEKKLIAGDLSDQLLTMRRRTVSAEQHLLELVARKPEQADAVKNQIECLVQGVCDDAKLLASAQGSVDGRQMLREVVTQLRAKAANEPQLVVNQPYEFLIGFAGLLTESCSVWWSQEFDLGGAA